MRTMAADIIVPLCTALLSAATAAELMKKTAPARLPGRFAERIFGKLKGNLYSCTLIGMTAVLQIIMLLTADGILSGFTVRDPDAKGSSGMSWFAVLLFSGFSFAALLAGLYCKKENLNRFIRKTAVVSAALLLAECFLFNGKSLTPDPQFRALPQLSVAENAEFTGDPSAPVRLNGEKAVIECTPSKDIRAVTICMEKKDVSRMIQVTASMEDDNFSRNYKQTDQRYVAGNGERFTLNLDPYGTPHSLRLTFSNIGEQVTVRSISESTAQPFRPRYLPQRAASTS